MTLTTAQIRQFGVPFREACTNFGTPELVEELLAAQADLVLPEMDAEKPVTSIIQGVLFIAQIPQIQKAKLEQKARALDAMRDHLQYWLEVGELVGFGNQVRPSSVRVPRKIARDFWRNAVIDREQETAADAERFFQRILIIDPMDFPDHTFFPPMGPRWFGQQFTTAMEELNSEFTNFRSNEMTHKERNALILKRVAKLNPTINFNERGFDTATIRRHFIRFRNHPKFKT